MAKMHATEERPGRDRQGRADLRRRRRHQGVKVEELYREIRALRIYEGATEVQKVVIARDLLKARRDVRAWRRIGGGDGQERSCRHLRARQPAAARAVARSCSTHPDLQYPERLNCVVPLLDRWVAEGHGDRPCLFSPDETLTYAELQERVNRICNVLVRDLGLVPGNRVLPALGQQSRMVATYLAG